MRFCLSLLISEHNAYCVHGSVQLTYNNANIAGWFLEESHFIQTCVKARWFIIHLIYSCFNGFVVFSDGNTPYDHVMVNAVSFSTGIGWCYGQGAGEFTQVSSNSVVRNSNHNAVFSAYTVICRAHTWEEKHQRKCNTLINVKLHFWKFFINYITKL